MKMKYTVISLIMQPVLAHASRADVIRFDETNRKFMGPVNTVNADRPADIKLQTPHIRVCIKVDLLQNLSTTEETPNFDEFEDVSDNMVQM